jgi:hypothetical protein
VRHGLTVGRLGSAVAVAAACGALEALAAGSIGRVGRSVSDADRIVAGLNATFVREGHLVESFATSKTFSMRVLGEYGLRSECGPYVMSMARGTAER